MSTIKEVAALAGVSVPTVYKVFSNTYYTSPDIREKVFEAAKKLNYIPKAVKKINEKEGTRIIALLLDEYVNPFYSRMIQEMAKELEHRGYRLMVMYSDYLEREKENFELALSHKCDGIIFIPYPEGDKEMIRTLKAKGIRMLQLFRTVHPQLDTLLIDDELGTYLAVQHLLQSGHKRIMLIGKTNPAIIKREVGYIRAYKAAGLPVDEKCLYLMEYAECAKEMVKQKMAAVKPTAILSVGESTSINVLQALNELNLSIPEDMSLIIYDDLAWAATYGITTVAHSYETIGKLIAEMVDSQFRNEVKDRSDQPARLILDPMLAARNSVKILK